MERVGEELEKKVGLSLSKKYDEIGVGKIKEEYKEAVKKVELLYQKEL
jgi:hypothetical protein